MSDKIIFDEELDAELHAMKTIAAVLAQFDEMPPGPIERILRWALDRYAVDPR